MARQFDIHDYASVFGYSQTWAVWGVCGSAQEGRSLISIIKEANLLQERLLIGVLEPSFL